MSSTTRFIVVIVTLVAVQLIVVWTTQGYTKASVVSNAECFDDFTFAIDGWVSEPVGMDSRTIDAVGACDQINHRYLSADGHSVEVHLGSWDRLLLELPHEPTHCYAAQGWKINAVKSLPVRTPTAEHRLSLMQLSRNSDQLWVAYCYLRGGKSYTDRSSMRRVHRDLWGKEKWPPIYKVMLQTTAYNESAAKKRLETVAKVLLARVGQLSAR